MAAKSGNGEGRRIRLWAIIVGVIAAILAVASFITQIVDVEDQLIQRDGLTVIVLHIDSLFIYLSAVVAVTGFIISWWHKLPAGILLVLAGVCFIVIEFLPHSFLAPTPIAASGVSVEVEAEPAFIFGIPAFVAGVLFLWYWWVSEKSI
jgi:hypothetical protein